MTLPKARYGGSPVVLGPCRCKSCGLLVVWNGWGWYDIRFVRLLHRCWS